MSTVSSKVALSNMRLIAEMGKHGMLEYINIAKADFERVTGSLPWLGVERGRMTVALQQLIYCAVDAQNSPRFPLSAEYLAAGIAMYVHPGNMQLACTWIADTSVDNATLQRKSDMLSSTKSPDRIMPDQLFALVCDIYADPQSGQWQSLFVRNTGLALEGLTVRQDKGKGIKK